PLIPPDPPEPLKPPDPPKPPVPPEPLNPPDPPKPPVPPEPLNPPLPPAPPVPNDPPVAVVAPVPATAPAPPVALDPPLAPKPPVAPVAPGSPAPPEPAVPPALGSSAPQATSAAATGKVLSSLFVNVRHMGSRPPTIRGSDRDLVHRGDAAPVIRHEAVERVARLAAGDELDVAEHPRGARDGLVVAEPTERVKGRLHHGGAAHVEAARLDAGAALTHQAEGADPAAADGPVDDGGVVLDARVAAHVAANDLGVGTDVDAGGGARRGAAAAVAVAHGAAWTGFELAVLEARRPGPVDVDHVRVAVDGRVRC